MTEFNSRELTISKEFTLEVAHWLPNVPETHKCHGKHGHSVSVEIEVGCDVWQTKILPTTDNTNPDQSKSHDWVMDFGEISAIFQRDIHAKLDHKTLNDIPGLENPTSENLAQWVWHIFDANIPLTMSLAVIVRETRTSKCRFAKNRQRKKVTHRRDDQFFDVS